MQAIYRQNIAENRSQVRETHLLSAASRGELDVVDALNGLAGKQGKREVKTQSMRSDTDTASPSHWFNLSGELTNKAKRARYYADMNSQCEDIRKTLYEKAKRYDDDACEAQQKGLDLL